MDAKQAKSLKMIIKYLEKTLKDAKNGNITYLTAVTGNDFDNGGFSMCNIVDINSVPHVVGVLSYLKQDMLKQYHEEVVEGKTGEDVTSKYDG